MAKAVIFFAQGLEECDGLITVDILRRAGVEVTVAAVGGSVDIVSSHGVHIKADARAEDVDLAAFDAAILPGGMPGTLNLKADDTVRRVCCAYDAAGKTVAAICAAPTALAAFGLLKGKNATVYPGADLVEALKAGGARYTGAPVTVDGHIVTGEALGAAIPFALTLAGALAGAPAAAKVKAAIVDRA